MARHELGCVLEHVNEAMQLTQNIIRKMPRRFGLAVNVNWHIQILAPYFINEMAQVHHRRIQIRSGCELFVVNRQDKRTGAALLLCELTEVAVAGGAKYIEAF